MDSMKVYENRRVNGQYFFYTKVHLFHTITHPIVIIHHIVIHHIVITHYDWLRHQIPQPIYAKPKSK